MTTPITPDDKAVERVTSVDEKPVLNKDTGRHEVNGIEFWDDGLIAAFAQKWVAWNAKIISAADFYGDTHREPDAFFGVYPTECTAAWHEYVGYMKREKVVKEKRGRKEKAERRNKNYCSCNSERKLEPNAIQGNRTEHPSPIRLWYCNVHKSCSTSLGHYPANEQEINTLRKKLNITTER